MLVLQSTYDKLRKKYRHLEQEAVRLSDVAFRAIDTANQYIDKYNHLKNEQQNVPTTTFTQEELKSLLALVHPDKHQSRSSAVQQNATVLTQKILKLAGK